MSRRKPLPPREELHRLFSYDEASGVLTWKIKPAGPIQPGQVAGKRARNGYIRICYQGSRYFAHRVIFSMQTGQEPTFIDHIDGDTSNNRLSNLRAVSHRENNRNRTRLNKNNKSGVSGVFWNERRQRWVAAINMREGIVQVGAFTDLEEARIATDQRRKELYAEVRPWLKC